MTEDAVELTGPGCTLMGAESTGGAANVIVLQEACHLGIPYCRSTAFLFLKVSFKVSFAPNAFSY